MPVKEEKHALLEIDLSRFYRSLESASVAIKSPTGRQLWIRKASVDYFTDEEMEVWQRIAQHHQRELVNLSFSYREMELMKAMADIPQFRPPADRVKIKNDRIAKIFA